MSEKSQSTHVIGLNIDGGMVKAAALTLRKRSLLADAVFEFPYETPQTSSESEFLTPLSVLGHHSPLLKTHLVSTALDAQEVLVRPLDLKIKKKKDIEAVLKFQAEPLLPYPPEEGVLDRIVLDRSKEGCRLTILAAKKEHVASHIDQWKKLSIEPELVSSASQALTVFASYHNLNEKPFYAVHLGFTSSFAVLIEQGKLVASQSIEGGLDEIASVLAHAREIELTEARQQLFDPQFNFQEEDSSIKAAFENLRIAITRTLYALTKQIRGKETNELLLTGPGGSVSGFSNYLAKALQKTNLSVKENFIQGISLFDIHYYALPLGLALNALPAKQKNVSDQINFRQDELTYPYPWKRLKKPMAIYLLLCFVLSAAVLLFGHAYKSYKEKEIKYQYLELLSVMNKPYTQFEEEFKAKSSPEHEGAHQIKEIQLFSSEDIQKRLMLLEKEIQATPQTFPLQPNVPLVSDLLAWLSTHASFSGTLQNDTLVPGLQIESFSYAMVKRPEPVKKQEKYQVKVELEFSSSTPKMAREFHDALITPNEMVDAKAEIKWSSNKDRYRTSFYLKDKTIYTSP